MLTGLAAVLSAHVHVRGAVLPNLFRIAEQDDVVFHEVADGAPAEKDPLVGSNDGSATFTIPRSPVRRRLHGLQRFTVTRGGEYCFVPSLSALRWLSELDP